MVVKEHSKLKEKLEEFQNSIIYDISATIENRLNDIVDQSDHEKILLHAGTIHGLDLALGKLGRSLKAVAIPLRAEDIIIDWQRFYEQLPSMMEDDVLSGLLISKGVVRIVENTVELKPAPLGAEESKKLLSEFEKAFAVDANEQDTGKS